MISSRPTRGSGGPALVTAFMPPIPSKLTMLIPKHIDTSLGHFQNQFIDAQIAANKIDLWNNCNPFLNTNSGVNAPSCILGSLVTAPDGTLTARHLVEAANNGIHRMQAACEVQGNNFPAWPNLRLAVIAKAAERTRIRLAIMWNSFTGPGTGFWTDASSAGAKTVFDLAGGQIGVANTTFNGSGQSGFPLIAGPTSMTPLGGGWYLCCMDASVLYPGMVADHIIATVLLDNGSGTSPESTSYLGDGVSGVNVWTTSMLPAAAWAMSGRQVLFDDFNNLSTIDLGDTRQPGFNWYIHRTWPHPGFTAPPNNPVNYTQANSVLTLSVGTDPNGCDIESAASISDGVYVGRTYGIPALFESRFSMGWPDPNNWQGGIMAFWSMGVTLMANSSPYALTVEMDFYEASFYPYGSFTFHSWQAFNLAIASFAAWAGYPQWSPTWIYDQAPPAGGPGAFVGQSGGAYSGLVVNNHNNNPLTTVGVDWSLISPTGVAAAISTPDITQMHVRSTLALPPSLNDAGWCITFFDGIPCNCTYSMPTGTNNICTIAPYVHGYPDSWAKDTYVFIISTGPTGSTSVDYMSVTQ